MEITGKINDFDQKAPTSGFVTMIHRTDLLCGGGFLVNGEVNIVVEMESVVEESEETGSPLKKMEVK